MTQPPVCDYEGSDYQSSFWDRGDRAYEDGVEAVALKRLLPKGGRLMLELGAGAGRNTPRYVGFQRVVLVDYSRTQLQQAQARLGNTGRYVFVAADIYRLPFVDGVFDAATMIRTLHHMADAPRALAQVRGVLAPRATFILEYANKQNSKAILRYGLGRQAWSPFAVEPVEFADLNFDFHPKTVRSWLRDLGFNIDRVLTVSRFRAGILKRVIPASALVALDSVFQWTGVLWQLTPSVFVRATLPVGGASGSVEDIRSLFKCPDCGHTPLMDQGSDMACPECKRVFHEDEGIYDFRHAVS
jgi:ubiquinone/menaquinone biosynthesis C-methylase UbiE